MMGDGLHYESDGKWIPREYKKILKALGFAILRKNNINTINNAMFKKLKTAQCLKCKGQLKQTKSGSYRAICLDCAAIFQFKKIKDSTTNG